MVEEQATGEAEPLHRAPVRLHLARPITHT